MQTQQFLDHLPATQAPALQHQRELSALKRIILSKREMFTFYVVWLESKSRQNSLTHKLRKRWSTRSRFQCHVKNARVMKQQSTLQVNEK
jgi:hypothetical protein